MNRNQRRRRGVNKRGMNDVEFQQFMQIELERRRRVFTPSAVAVAVRRTLGVPRGR